MLRKRINRPAIYALVAVMMVLALGLAEARAGYRYDSHGRRDPFVPLIGVERSGAHGGIRGISSVDDIALQGIIVGDDGKKRVILNGEILKEGDKIDRLSVESIGDNAVKVKIEDSEYEIKLYK